MTAHAEQDLPRSNSCRATYEAVREWEDEHGEACPLCGLSPHGHPSEDQGRETPQIVNGQQVGP